MTRTNWKRVRPVSLPHAMSQNLKHALEKHNRSVEGVAALMGLSNPWSLYKYVESGRIPACLIPPFEEACGIDLVSQWIASSRGKLLISVPTGRCVKPADIADLQANTHNAIGALMNFYAGKADAAATLAAVQQAIHDFAWHQQNVVTYDAPQLDFSGDDA